MNGIMWIEALASDYLAARASCLDTEALKEDVVLNLDEILRYFVGRSSELKDECEECSGMEDEIYELNSDIEDLEDDLRFSNGRRDDLKDELQEAQTIIENMREVLKGYD